MLDSLLTDELRLNEFQKRALNNIGMKTAKDLLWHFPARYEEFASASAIADLIEGTSATIRGKILKTKMERTWRKKMTIAEATLSDGAGEISLVWFHQPYIAKMLKAEDIVAVTGKIQKNKKGLYIANPSYEKLNPDEMSPSLRFIPIYPETRGLSSRWIRFTIRKILKKFMEKKDNSQDAIPDFILSRYHLPSLKNALVYIHVPRI